MPPRPISPSMVYASPRASAKRAASGLLVGSDIRLEPWFDGSFLAQHGNQSVLPPDERQPKLMLDLQGHYGSHRHLSDKSCCPRADRASLRELEGAPNGLIER